MKVSAAIASAAVVVVVLSGNLLLAGYPDECLGLKGPSLEACPDWLTYQGCCDGQGRLVWCSEAGEFYCVDCPALDNPTCGWTGTVWGGYDCGEDGGEDPAGLYPKQCFFCEPPCAAGTKCEAGQCVPCTPDCIGKECGDDKCGGECGECAAGLFCSWEGKCLEYQTCAVAAALHCGEAVQGDNTGKKAILETYACDPDFDFDGAEIAYSFFAVVDDTIFLTMQEKGSGWHEMLWLEGTCGEDACTTYGMHSLEVEVKHGTTYYVVLDGWEGDEGAFVLNLKCKSACQPECKGKQCGDDGCWGTCGECPEGEACMFGECGPNDGCTPTDSPGCGGCLCESCVCDPGMFPSCCSEAWDDWCVWVCQDWCTGCGTLVNCGDGTCDPDAFETCDACPDDCGCAEGEQCYLGACCLASCEGKECGDDGCGGECGEPCAYGNVCIDGQCGPNNGCVESWDPGCGGCPCEDCVCAQDSYCCEFEWDWICIGECESDCGGCISLVDCGNGECGVYETCANCPEDCECPAGQVCSPMGTCCTPSCDGKECGGDGCGGDCGKCPCPDCEADETWCGTGGVCVAGDKGACQALAKCGWQCDAYDYECWDACLAAAPPEAISAYEAWTACLEDAGYSECWDFQCVLDVYEGCLPVQWECIQGEASCLEVAECTFACTDEEYCLDECLGSGSLGAMQAWWPFLECAAMGSCADGFDSYCLGQAKGDCQAELEACYATCTPACGDQECGDDGCGGVCGECEKGQACKAGKCEDLCVPQCAGKDCGNDGCDGSCGTCPEGEQCIGGKCTCVPECEGRECGDDTCGGSCGECEKGFECDGSGLCGPICVTSCEGKQCGGDGCGGSCGECPEGQTCDDSGLCFEPSDDPVLSDIVVPDGATSSDAGVEAPVAAVEEETAGGGSDGCGTAPGSSGPAGWLLLLAAGLILTGLRRATTSSRPG